MRGSILFRAREMALGAFAERGERLQYPYSDGVFFQQGVRAGPFRAHTALEKADQRRDLSWASTS